MREARPDLSMRTTPCMKYRDAWCGAWSFPPYRAELDKPPPSQSKQHRALSCLFPVSLSCSRTCLAKMLKYKQTDVCKLLLMAFCLPVPNSLFLISVRCVKQFVYFCISLGFFVFFVCVLITNMYKLKQWIFKMNCQIKEDFLPQLLSPAAVTYIRTKMRSLRLIYVFTCLTLRIWTERGI